MRLSPGKLASIFFGFFIAAPVQAQVPLGPPAPAALSPQAQVQAQAQAALALEEAVRLALAQNERALKAPLRVSAAEGQLKRARAAFLPNLNVNGAGTLGSAEDRAGRAITGTGALSLSQPLINLSAIPLYRQARHQLEGERWGAVQDQRQLAFDTARAFLVVLTSERVLAAATSRRDRALANQNYAQVRAAAQIASTNDVTRASLETADAATQVAQAQGSVARAYLSLAYLVGQQVAGPLAPPESTFHAAETVEFNVDEMVRLAAERRPDVRSVHERTAALYQAAQEPLFRLAPTLAASGQVRLTPAAGEADPIHSETLQLNLNWELYDGGSRYGDRQTRLAQAESQALDERMLLRSIVTDVGLALASLQAARTTYHISETAVAGAQRNTTETTLLYKQSLARALEVTDANASRFSAEVVREQAKLTMQQAYLDLRYALGLDPLGNEFDHTSTPPKGTP